MKLTESVRSFHVPETPRTSAWPPRIPFGTDLARHARDFRGKRTEPIDQGIDRVFHLQDLTGNIDGDFSGEIAVGDRGRNFRDVAHLRRSGCRPSY